MSLIRRTVALGAGLGIAAVTLTGFAATDPTAEPTTPATPEATEPLTTVTAPEDVPADLAEAPQADAIAPALPVVSETPAAPETATQEVTDSLWPYPPQVVTDDPNFPPLTLYPCATDGPDEDGAACYWDARTMGNGTGVSFIMWQGEFFYAE
jgi:hypothetical protein